MEEVVVVGDLAAAKSEDLAGEVEDLSLRVEEEGVIFGAGDVILLITFQ